MENASVQYDPKEDDEIAYIDSKVNANGVRYERKGESPFIVKPQKPTSKTKLVFKTIFMDDGKTKLRYEIIVKANSLKALLKQVIDPYLVHEEIRWTKKDVVLKEPFLPIVHYLRELRDVADGKGAGSAASEVDRGDLKKLLNHVEALSPVNARSLGEAYISNKIAYEGLWALYRPGTLVAAQPFADEPQFFIVRQHGVSRMKTGFFVVTCMSFDWTGSQLERHYYDFVIESFEGSDRAVRDLPLYPVEHFKENLATVKDMLMKRGQRFREVCVQNLESKKRYKFSGKAVTGISPKAWVGDFACGSQHSELRLEALTFSCCTDSGLKLRADMLGSGADDIPTQRPVVVDFSSFRRWQPGRPVLGHMAPLRMSHCHCDLCYSSSDDAWLRSFANPDSKPESFADHPNMLLLPARVLGYVLREGVWAQMSIDGLDSDEDNPDEMFDSELVLAEDGVMDGNKKALLKTLVCNHGRDDADSADFVTNAIEGKGLGLIILLHGPPGVGKTFTAEALARASRRPLHIINASLLSLNPQTIEAELKDMFELAEAWNAILLIDEVDVLVDARGNSMEVNSNKNAVVSVMLRALECFSGVLIMTTNRVISLESAIMSRINFALNYGPLTKGQLAKIWSNWGRKLTTKNCDNPEDVRRWIQAELKRGAREVALNGHEIRNMFVTALTLAKDSDGRVTRHNLEVVLQVRSDFQSSHQIRYI